MQSLALDITGCCGESNILLRYRTGKAHGPAFRVLPLVLVVAFDGIDTSSICTHFPLTPFFSLRLSGGGGQGLLFFL